MLVLFLSERQKKSQKERVRARVPPLAALNPMARAHLDPNIYRKRS